MIEDYMNKRVRHLASGLDATVTGQSAGVWSHMVRVTFANGDRDHMSLTRFEADYLVWPGNVVTPSEFMARRKAKAAAKQSSKVRSLSMFSHPSVFTYQITPTDGGAA